MQSVGLEGGEYWFWIFRLCSFAEIREVAVMLPQEQVTCIRITSTVGNPLRPSRK